MITLVFNREEYEYDCYALVTSFYPGEETKQLIGEASDGEDAPLPDRVRITALPEERRAEVFFSAGEVLPADRRYTMEKAGDFKKAFKQFFYETLTDYTGRRLPWGSLTGVRPTKLILSVAAEEAEKLAFSAAKTDDVMQNGGQEKRLKDAVVSRMQREYRVSEEKAALGLKIALLEDRILQKYRGGGYSLYIGIPFCPSRCLYCSFLSYTIESQKKKIADYLECLKKEMTATMEIMNGQRPDTVYIGGGTPTALDADGLHRLLSDVDAVFFGGGMPDEYTVEAGRPDSITKEKLEVMKEFGVSRISVNPQTFHQETLDLIGRRHTVKETIEAYELARSMGFDNINMDLILGLPGEGPDEVRATLDRVRELSPDSLTVHSLALKRASKMRDWVREHGALLGIDYDAVMRYAQETANLLGMDPYYLYRQKNIAGSLENTGFAKEGKYGLYNIIIMEEVQSIYAIGAGTVSKKVYTDGSGRIERCDTHKDLSLYLSDIQAMIERKRKLFGEDK